MHQNIRKDLRYRLVLFEITRKLGKGEESMFYLAFLQLEWNFMLYMQI